MTVSANIRNTLSFHRGKLQSPRISAKVPQQWCRQIYSKVLARGSPQSPAEAEGEPRKGLIRIEGEIGPCGRGDFPGNSPRTRELRPSTKRDTALVRPSEIQNLGAEIGFSAGAIVRGCVLPNKRHYGGRLRVSPCGTVVFHLLSPRRGCFPPGKAFGGKIKTCQCQVCTHKGCCAQVSEPATFQQCEADQRKAVRHLGVARVGEFFRIMNVDCLGMGCDLRPRLSVFTDTSTSCLRNF